MHIDPYIVLGSAIIGLLVGMTGAGGGALMTPMLILFKRPWESQFAVPRPAPARLDADDGEREKLRLDRPVAR